MSDSSPRRVSVPVLLAIALVVVSIGLALRASLRDPVEIRASPVTHENLISTVPTNGKVEPIELFQAHAPNAGVIDRVFVSVGQKVTAGQLLLRMDDSDVRARLATAQAGVTTAEATSSDILHGGSQSERLTNTTERTRDQQQLAEAQQTLASLQKLEARGAASPAEVAAAQNRLTAAQSALKSSDARISTPAAATDQARARGQLNDARAALIAAQSAYERVNVRGRFAGTVYSLPVSDYDFVQAGEDLLDLADLNRMHVIAYFDEPDIGKLSVGQPVKIVWDARPNRTWHGHVEVVPTTVIAYGSRNVGECLITVDDANGDLLPNTNVTVTVTYSQRFNVLSIPREALHTDGPTSYVFRVVNHHLQRTVVGVGASNPSRIEITSGLSESDTVALNATNNRDLTNGLLVRVVE